MECPLSAWSLVSSEGGCPPLCLRRVGEIYSWCFKSHCRPSRPGRPLWKRLWKPTLGVTGERSKAGCFICNLYEIILGGHLCFFFFFLNLFFYLFMAVLGLCFCARAFSSCGKWGPLFIAVHGRPLLLWSTGSRRTSSAIVVHGPSCSAACGIFPDQGSNPCPLHWQADSQPLCHQGSPTSLL